MTQAIPNAISSASLVGDDAFFDQTGLMKNSDALMEKFFGEEEFTRDEAVEAIHEGIIHGDIVPVFCGAAVKMWGIKTLLDTIADSFPRPTARKVEHGFKEDGSPIEIPIEPEGETSIFVFKTVADPFVGKMSFFKVMNGELAKDATLRNTTNGQIEKFGRLYLMRGKKQTDVEVLCCGDIGVTGAFGSFPAAETE